MIIVLNTGFLFQLADGDEVAWNLYSRLLDDLKQFHLITIPAVRDVLDLLAYTAASPISGLILHIWHGLSGEWRLSPVTLMDSQKKLASAVSYHFREKGLLARERILESQVLANRVCWTDQDLSCLLRLNF